MIKVFLKKEKNQIKEISLKGHAFYDDYGKDIVCAGVSSIMTTTINAALLIDEQSVVYSQQKDKFQIEVKKTDEVTQKLMQNMINLLKELQTDYPKNIKVEEE